MPLDPRLQPIVDLMNGQDPPDDTGLSVAELRERAHAGMELSFLALGEPGPDVASIVEHRVAVGAEGVPAGEITVRVYTPFGDGPFPGHLYLHGGGFWLGTPSQFDNICQTIAEGAGCVVASVDYRLAPEYRFPVAPEDCYAALGWFADRADELDVDATRISVGGGSAGGNLSAVVALMARDRGGPPLVFQVLEIPATDLTGSHPSIEENGEGYLLTKAAMQQCVDYYLAEPGHAEHPYASPMFADDLAGLPPALVMTAELDPLRDEGEAYAERLRAAGVPTVSRRWEGQFHGSQTMAKVIPDAVAEYADMVTTALRKAYATG